MHLTKAFILKLKLRSFCYYVPRRFFSLSRNRGLIIRFNSYRRKFNVHEVSNPRIENVFSIQKLSIPSRNLLQVVELDVLSRDLYFT